MYTPFYTYTSHWTIAFRARLKLHFLTHKFFRPNTPGFAIFPRSKARPFSSSLPPHPDPRSHPVLHPVHIDRSTTVASISFANHLDTHSLSLSTDSHRLKFTRVNHAYLHVVITEDRFKKLGLIPIENQIYYQDLTCDL